MARSATRLRANPGVLTVIGGLEPALMRIIAGSIMLHGGMAGLRMAAPLAALDQGYGAAAVGFLLAMFALSQILLALPAGRYADKHGLRRPAALSAIAISVGGLLAVALPVFPVLCVTALLAGAGAGVSSIALQRHVGRAAQGSAQLRQAFSWFSIGPAISNFVGPFLAGLVIDHAGFRAAFLVMAILPLLSWFWLRKTQELAPIFKPGQRAGGGAWELLKERSFRRLLIINWVVASCWDIHSFVVPLIGHERGFSASVIGAILGAFAVAAAMVRVVLPIVAAHVQEWGVLAISTVVTAILFAIYPLLDSPLAMGLASVGLGMVLGTGQPMIMSMLHQITPHERHGQAVAVRMITIHASGVLMPMLFGLAGAYIGISGVFWCTAGIVAAATRVPFLLRSATRADKTS